MIANENPMKVAFTAMRLGGTLFLIPFFFALNPSIIFIGGITEIVLSIIMAIIGVFLIACSFEGYYPYFGIISGKINTFLSYIIRIVIGVAGSLIALPGYPSNLIGSALAVCGLVALLVIKNKFGRKLTEVG